VSWDNIIQTDLYRGAGDNEKLRIKGNYFDTFLAPEIPLVNRETAKDEFLNSFADRPVV